MEMAGMGEGWGEGESAGIFPGEAKWHFLQVH